MDNKFFKFVETYKDDIKAFFDALATSTKEYKEKVDLSSSDERNRFLSMKAWSWAGYLFVIIAAVTSIALRIGGHDELSAMASYGVCLVVALYWLSWLWLRKKY